MISICIGVGFCGNLAGKIETQLINALVVEGYAVAITTMWASGNTVRIVAHE